MAKKNGPVKKSKAKNSAKTKAKTRVKAKVKKVQKPKLNSTSKSSAKQVKKTNTKKQNKSKMTPGALAKSKRKQKKVNLLKLYNVMNKHAKDAVDKEVIKRFKIIIDTSEEDITKKSLSTILKDQKNIDPSEFHDSLQPYIKHYLFLHKRSLIKS